MTALIIDDEKEICLLVSNFLKKAGVHCDMAHDLTSGLEKVRKSSFNLVFLDLNLPDGYGLDVVEKIRNQPDLESLYIISAHDSDEERQKASSLGVKGFIKKPFSKKDIMNTLNF